MNRIFRTGDKELIAKYGNVTICGDFIADKPNMVRCMMRVGLLPMADDRRGLLTPREREILTGDADVTDEYYYSVVSRVRRKIQKTEDDAQVLKAHHKDLYQELRQAVSGEEERDDE